MLSSPTTAPFQGQYAVDPDHSSFAFAVRHMGVSTFRGSFSGVTAEVSADERGVLRIAGEVPVEGLSVRAPHELRTHLLGEDFFDAARHPAIAFEAGGVAPSGDGTLTAAGRLTIRDVTREVVARGTWSGPVEDPFGGVRGALELSATVDRRDFGMSWNLRLPKGGDALGNEVTITAQLELVGR